MIWKLVKKLFHDTHDGLYSRPWNLVLLLSTFGWIMYWCGNIFSSMLVVPLHLSEANPNIEHWFSRLLQYLKITMTWKYYLICYIDVYLYVQIENSKDAQLWPYEVSTIVKVIFVESSFVDCTSELWRRVDCTLAKALAKVFCNPDTYQLKCALLHSSQCLSML